MRIEVLIFSISILLISHFSFQLFIDISNQVGIVPLISSSFMILLSFVSVALISSHWKESQEAEKGPQKVIKQTGALIE